MNYNIQFTLFIEIMARCLYLPPLTTGICSQGKKTNRELKHKPMYLRYLVLLAYYGFIYIEAQNSNVL